MRRKKRERERGGEGEGWGGGSLEVELTSRLGVMDVSIRDMETRSVTDISIIEIFRCVLPGLGC